MTTRQERFAAGKGRTPGKQPEFDNHRFGYLVYRRLKFAIALLVLVWLVLAARSLQIQVVMADRLRDRAGDQNKQIVSIPAARGEIFDRCGIPLAVNWHNESFYLYPDSQNIPLLAGSLSRLHGRTEREIKAELYNKLGQFIWLHRKADDRIAGEIRGWKVDGVYSMPEMTRVYPNGLAGRGVVGFVDTDNHGLAGVEFSCEKWLTGKKGETVLWRDGWGRKYPIDPLRVADPVSGCRVELTIDLNWQTVLEDELRQGVERYGARSGMAVLLDCRTGEILAISDATAGVDPAQESRKKSRVVTDVFEPGSSFKLVTFAAALSEGRVRPGDLFDGELGQARFSDRFLRDDKRHGLLTVADAFRVSSNIVTAKIANRVGGKVVHSWAKRFGFGAPTNVLLPGEQDGAVWDRRWSDYVTAAFSIGHGVSVTTLQLANAYATLANGGLLLRPYLVRSVTDAQGRVVYEGKPTVLRRVLSPDVAARLLAMARAVVTYGTAKPVNDPDFPLAGKTGTAEKPDLVAKRMIKNKYTASFVGFWPADNPRLLGAVVLDEPEPIHYGGYTAAPMLLNIFRRGSCTEEQPITRRPQLIAGVTPAGDTPQYASSRQAVGASIPPDSGRVSFWSLRQARIPKPDSTGNGTMPKLIGLTAREAVALLQQYGLEAALRGSGRVVQQAPDSGAVLGPGQLCELSLH